MILACNAAKADWVDAGLVTRIHSGHVGVKILFFSTQIQHAVANCGDNSHGYTVTDDGGASAKRIYATLMAAYMMNKPVGIFLTGGCPNGRPEVDSVQIKEVSYF